MDAEFVCVLIEMGYKNIRERNGEVICTADYMTTRGILVNVDPIGHARRYCYQDRDEADRAILAWADGEDHPPGNWIKLKGSFKGQPVDMLNPNWSKS